MILKIFSVCYVKMIHSNYPLKIFQLGLGGICKEFICPTSIDELLKIKFTKKKLFIRNGSNICFITTVIMTEPS